MFRWQPPKPNYAAWNFKPSGYILKTKKHYEKRSNHFIGIIAAATAGVVIGKLIAPEKGEDLRKSIRNSAADWSKRLQDLMAEGKAQFDGLKTMFAEGTRELQSDLKNSVTETTKKERS